MPSRVRCRQARVRAVLLATVAAVVYWKVLIFDEGAHI